MEEPSNVRLSNARVVCGMRYSAEEIIDDIAHFLSTDLTNYALTRLMAHDIIAELEFWKQYALELEGHIWG